MKAFIKFVVPILCILLISACVPLETALHAYTPTPTALPTVQVILPTPTATLPPITADASKLKGIQVFFMYPWSGDVATEMETLIGDFNQNNEWGIQVIGEAPGSAGSLYDTLTSDLKNAIPPAMIAAPIDDLLELNQSSKMIIDLAPYVASAQYGFSQSDVQNFSPVFWGQDVVDGYRYGIPAERSAKVLIYNSTWAKELGFANPPTTPDEFQTQVCAAHASLKSDSDPSNDGLGGWVIDTDAMTMDSWANTFGASLETNGSLKFATPAMTQTFAYLRNLLDNGCAWNSKDVAPYDYFANRQTLVYSADLEDLARQQQVQQLDGSQDEWMVIPFPTTNKPFLMTDGPSYAILSSSPEKELASWLFIRWLSSPENEGAMVKASTTLPLGENFVNASIDLEDSLPQWQQAVTLLPNAQTPPTDPEWGAAKMVWEDAAWQLFKTDVKPEQIPALTAEIDQTLADLEGTAQ